MSLHSRLRSAALVAAALSASACRSSSTSAGGAPAPASAGGGPAAKLAASKLPAGVTPAMISLGDSIFNNASCQRCHGKGGSGLNAQGAPGNGPSLVRTSWDHGSGSYEDIVKTIMSGVPKEQLKDQSRRFAMNPRGGGQVPLNDDQVKAVAAYVYSLNHK